VARTTAHRALAAIVCGVVLGTAAPATADGTGRSDVPARYAGLVLLAYPSPPLFPNLLYEGNNLQVRGPRSPDGAYPDGAEVARRWRRLAHGGRSLFALRDGLFAQQDHPSGQQPFALMMPASWVTAALADVAAGRTLRPVRTPPLDDEDAWRAIRTPAEVFGSFPRSPQLFALATSRADGDGSESVRHARAALRSLAADAVRMVRVQKHGADAVAAAGASRIARSDRRYFGGRRRRERVVLIAVENPTRTEVVREAKGAYVRGRPDIPAAIVERAHDAVYRRRLADGDLALERYDVTRTDDRRRAIRVLEAIVPRDRPSAGGVVWLWIVGSAGPFASTFAAPPDAVATLRRELADANVDLSRVRLLPRPALELPAGSSRRSVFEDHVDACSAQDLPCGVRIDSRELAALVAHGG
jgi:hypothetical protein